MQNSVLGANALWACTQGFITPPMKELQLLTLWHLVSVLPLVFHDTSRIMILKRRVSSGLRSILDREAVSSVAQNEAIFNIDYRLKAMLYIQCSFQAP